MQHGNIKAGYISVLIITGKILKQVLSGINLPAKLAPPYHVTSSLITNL